MDLDLKNLDPFISAVWTAVYQSYCKVFIVTLLYIGNPHKRSFYPNFLRQVVKPLMHGRQTVDPKRYGWCTALVRRQATELRALQQWDQTWSTLSLVLFKSLNVTKTINTFLAHFHFLKKLQIFLMLLGIMHAAPPLPKSPLISSYQQHKHLA